MIPTRLLSLALIAAAPAVAVTPDDASVIRLVDAFAAAQRAFDQAALSRLTAPDYVEISPLGEVDPRERMLGFYAPDKKEASPTVTVSERTVRVNGRMAIVTTRLSFAGRDMRVVYVARREAGGWLLVSAQYTPIRSPRPS